MYISNWDLSYSQHRTSLPSPGEKVAERQRGRMWNAGSNLNCGTRPRLLNMLPNHRPETDTKPQHFRPHSTSVTEIGSEEPISVPASPREKVVRCGAESTINPNLIYTHKEPVPSGDRLKFIYCVASDRVNSSEIPEGSPQKR